jgi:hypothetical protein
MLRFAGTALIRVIYSSNKQPVPWNISILLLSVDETFTFQYNKQFLELHFS